jgi:hypothetical protein
MNHEKKDQNAEASNQVLERKTRQSQDALRHERDALHHKFHKGPLRDTSLLDNKSARQPYNEAEQEGDLEQLEGQPEIPKVGSRDAPGG